MDKRSLISFFDMQADDWDNRFAPDARKLACLAALCGLEEDSRVLDVGCGTAQIFSALLTYRPSRLTGIDFSERMIEKARQKYTGTCAEFFCGDAGGITGQEFDCILLCDSFQFFENRGSLTRQMHHLLADGGRLMVCAPYGRAQINARAETTLFLPTCATLASSFALYFDVDIQIDSDGFYAVSGRKRKFSGK